MPRLIYASDLHGNLELYRAAGMAALSCAAHAVIFGGDLCPGTPGASRRNLPQAQFDFLLRDLAPMLEAWKKSRTGLRVLAIPGNDDCQTVLGALEVLGRRELIENLHTKSASLDSYFLIGLSHVPPTPFAIKDFERRDSRHSTEPLGDMMRHGVLGTPGGFQLIEDFDAYLDSHSTLEEELDRLPEQDAGRTIAVIHCPPFHTRCDMLFDGRHIGSKALRRWIERRQPLLTLHGHIHESPRLSGAFFDRIGRTIVVNPGCDGQRPHWVNIDLDGLLKLDHAIYGSKEFPSGGS